MSLSLNKGSGWAGLKSWSNRYVKSFDSVNSNLVEQIVREYQKIVLNNLETQAFDWVPLTDVYLEYKDITGLDDRTLIATGKLIDSIRVTKKSKFSYFAGIPKNAKYPSGVPVSFVAWIHEFGAPLAGIPSRPLWRPSLKELKNKLPHIAKGVVLKITKQNKL